MRKPVEEPGAWVVQSEWRELLTESLNNGRGDHWLSWWHLGLMEYAQGDAEAARHCWQRSLDRQPTAWAYRNLANLAQLQGNIVEAADLYQKALDLLPHLQPLVVEACRTWIDAGLESEVLERTASLLPNLRGNPRVQVLRAEAGLHVGRPEEMKAVLDDSFELPDLREGETTLSDLWFTHRGQMAAARAVPSDGLLRQRTQCDLPLPRHLDFRVTPVKEQT
jgi:tetratricopeptide (TPR) repeat protein